MNNCDTAEDAARRFAKEVIELRADNASLRAAGNKLAKIVSVAANAPVEQWATDEEINQSLSAWSAALGEGAKL